MRTIAIIPARGGSKGIPHKNIVDLGGIPLIAWSILVAKKVSIIEEVYVSTDDGEIARIATQYGANVPFLRPARLATDSARTVDAVADFLNKIHASREKIDAIVLLQPTQPFRSAESIERALNLFKEKGKGVVSVSLVDQHPILMRYFDSHTSQVKPLLLGTNSTIRRQDFPSIYRVNGSIYVNSVDDYINKCSLNDNPFAIVINKKEGVDIDRDEDLQYARSIALKEYSTIV